MKLLFFLTFLLAVCAEKPNSEVENHPANTDTLKLVQIIFRHGDRAPTNTYPNDPINDDPSAWPDGLAQLTNRGKMQQYKLGEYLRSRYDGFLDEKYRRDHIYVVSSDMDRTIMSVESNMAGLFPPVHKWNPVLDWDPIPLRTIPWKEDKYLHVNIHCPKYHELHRDFLENSEVVREMNDENRDFIEHLSKMSGLEATTVREIVRLQDIILVETIHNLTVPQWALDALPKLNELQAQINSWSTYTDEMKRLHGGPLLGLLLKNMIAKTTSIQASDPSNLDQERLLVVGGGERKMLVFSAHDSTLIRIMNTIGIYQPHNPPYASALLFELHQHPVSMEYFVKIFYRNSTTEHPHEMHIPGCPDFKYCSLKEVISLTKHLVPEDLEEECEVEEETVVDQPKKAQSPTVIPNCKWHIDPFYVTVIAISIFVGSVALCCCLSGVVQRTQPEGCSRCRCLHYYRSHSKSSFVKQFTYEKI